MKKWVTLFCLIAQVTIANAQWNCKIYVQDAVSKQSIKQASVFIEDSIVTFSNDYGYISIPCYPVQRIRIQTLMCDTILNFTQTQIPDTVTLYCQPFNLQPVSILPNDARSIIERAVQRIPENYPQTSYVLYGFYRNYRNINHYFRELTEAQAACVYRMDTTNANEVNEAFGVQMVRRTPYTLPINEFYNHQLEDLFQQNLVYHPAFAAFNSLYRDKSIFEIDSSLSTDTTWFIRYTLQNLTGENHGIENYVPESFAGEGTETGYFIIHKSDLAFLTIVRESIRNPKYAYPGHNNFLHPDMQYTGEFNEGFLEIQYVKKDDSYYPARLFHAYSNTYTYNPTNQIEWRITEYSEWWSDSITDIISSSLMQALLTYQSDFNLDYTYQASEWDNTPNWYFVRKEQVFSDLELIDQPGQLFINGGK